MAYLGALDKSYSDDLHISFLTNHRNRNRNRHHIRNYSQFYEIHITYKLL